MTNTQFPREGKMRVTPEQSRVLQERLFEEGFCWSGDRYSMDVSFTEAPFLIWSNDDMGIGYLAEYQADEFPEIHVPEYQFSDLFQPFDIAGGIVDIITILKNTRDAELVKKVLEMIKK